MSSTRSDRPLAEHVAVITGASRGIGAAVARALHSHGCRVILAARSEPDIDRLANELGEVGPEALAIVTDLTVTGDMDRLVAKTERVFGRLDVLVNNAGTVPAARRHERVDVAEWNDVLTLNLTSAWYLATRAHRLLKRQGGVVVNVASSAGHYPIVGRGAYCVSKAALIMLTRSLAVEWARDAIRVVSVSPGKVDTEMARPILEWVETSGAAINPLGRLAAPSEVADLIAFLAGSGGAYMTGCDIAFDGGEIASAS